MTTLIHAPNSPTSHAAAVSIQPKAPSLRQRVLAYITANDGATIDELSENLDMLTATACGRISELKALGEIEASNTTRLTRSGKKAVVWVVAGPTEIEQGRLSL